MWFPHGLSGSFADLERLRLRRKGDVDDMSTVQDRTREQLKGIWLATIRAQRRRQVENALIVAAGIVSGCFITLGLFYVYSALAGLR